MKRTLYTLIFILSGFVALSQTTTDTINRSYISLKSYKLKYEKPLTKKDSLSFLFRNKDTLVLMNEHRYLSPNGTRVPYEYKDSTFLHYYKKVAFNHYKDSISKDTSMKYWKDDIRIFFSESVSRKTRKDFMSFAKTIDKAVDSLGISEVKKLEDSNYVIYYFGDFDYESRMTNYKKSSFYSLWNQNKIYRTSIKLDAQVYFGDDLKQFQLREYFIQSLGYFKLNDDFACESYFADCYSPNKRLTPLDLELLKYHYSYGICKGTSLETFEDQHRKSKEILENTGTLVYFLHDEKLEN